MARGYPMFLQSSRYRAFGSHVISANNFLISSAKSSAFHFLNVSTRVPCISTPPSLTSRRPHCLRAVDIDRENRAGARLSDYFHAADSKVSCFERRRFSLSLSESGAKINLSRIKRDAHISPAKLFPRCQDQVESLSERELSVEGLCSAARRPSHAGCPPAHHVV